MKQRVHVIGGSDASILEKLACVVAAENVPMPMGAKELDFDAWLTERTRSESS